MWELFIWAGIFLFSLYLMIKGTDVFLENAERLGLFFKMPAFVIGVLIVGVGTSLPELTSSIVAVLRGVPEVVAAGAVGSNIANILLVGGIVALIGNRIRIDKDLLDAELPFFVLSTALFMGVAWDGKVGLIEALLLTATYAVYLFYLFSAKNGMDVVVAEKRAEIRAERKAMKFFPPGSVVFFAVLGLAGLLGGAKFVVEALIGLAEALKVPPGVLSISALALGTSLPELSVSVRALKKNNFEVALGNIFGSNAFNILLAVGLPALLGGIALDEATLRIGLPILGVASLVLLVIGMARRLYRWEGIMFLILYAFFLLKLIGL